MYIFLPQAPPKSDIIKKGIMALLREWAKWGGKSACQLEAAADPSVKTTLHDLVEEQLALGGPDPCLVAKSYANAFDGVGLDQSEVPSKDELIVQTVSMNYGMKQFDPVRTGARFYGQCNEDETPQAHVLEPDQVSHIAIPKVFSEKYVRLYCKRPAQARGPIDKNVLIAAFREWTRQQDMLGAPTPAAQAPSPQVKSRRPIQRRNTDPGASLQRLDEEVELDTAEQAVSFAGTPSKPSVSAKKRQKISS